MNALICTWLLLSGTWYNTQYIKFIKYENEIINKQAELKQERLCVPYIEIEPCFLYYHRMEYERTDPIYKVTIANTESGGDVRYVHDTTLKISSFNNIKDFDTIENYIENCISKTKS